MDSEFYLKTLDRCFDCLEFMGHMIDEYGMVVAVGVEYPNDERLARVHHDYIYFCLTRITRSLLAASELAKLGFREDVMSIVRTAYETYLLLGNSLNKQEFVYKPVVIATGLHEGVFYHPKKGKRIDFSKVIDRRSKKETNYDMRISTLARGTYCYYDKLLHKTFYQYLSEYIHGDFMCSGDYRTSDDTCYDVEPKCYHLQTIFSISYMCLLTLQSIYLYHREFNDLTFTSLYMAEVIELGAIEGGLNENLIEMIKHMDFSQGKQSMKELFIKRVNWSTDIKK